MDRPTQEQIKEPTQEQKRVFWEWCGIKPERQVIDTTGEFGGRFIYDYLPPIDLNNLFKYAVPKAIERIASIFKVSSVFANLTLFNWWVERINKGEDPALALFWVLWQVKEENK